MSFLPAALAIAGPIIKGVSGKIAGDKNAKRLRAQEREEQVTAVADRNRVREEVRSAIGMQVAAQVANGLEGGSGTALDALRQSQIEGALDVLEMRRQGELRARALRTAAKDAKRAGNMALIEGIVGAGSSVIKGRSDWAQERRLDG